MAILYRRRGAHSFTERDVRLVASLSSPLGEALRMRARASSTRGAPPLPRAPGVLLFTTDGTLTSANEQAAEWLAQLPPCGLSQPTDLGLRLPAWLTGVVLGAAEAAHGHGDGTARARMRTRHGLWLVCHAACLRDAAGNPHAVTAVIEPAKAAEIAPIIVEAYDLSQRERQITQLLTRGASTAEIAEQLHLSRHTVRDYVKDVLRKVGVGSRGELLAKLFAEHYEPTHFSDVVHCRDDS
jgi:DNA-binding CsgD family transcriptional regulator